MVPEHSVGLMEGHTLGSMSRVRSQVKEPLLGLMGLRIVVGGQQGKSMEKASTRRKEAKANTKSLTIPEQEPMAMENPP